MAVSLASYRSDEDPGFVLARKVVTSLLSQDGLRSQLQGGVLNVNVPNCSEAEFQGFRVCSLGHRVYDSRFHENADPRGKPYYWLGGGGVKSRDIPGSDCEAIAARCASLTMLTPSLYAQDASQAFADRYLSNLETGRMESASASRPEGG